MQPTAKSGRHKWGGLLSDGSLGVLIGKEIVRFEWETGQMSTFAKFDDALDITCVSLERSASMVMIGTQAGTAHLFEYGDTALPIDDRSTSRTITLTDLAAIDSIEMAPKADRVFLATRNGVTETRLSAPGTLHFSPMRNYGIVHLIHSSPNQMLATDRIRVYGGFNAPNSGGLNWSILE